jgi:hypothetical protein
LDSYITKSSRIIEISIILAVSYTNFVLLISNLHLTGFK